MRKLVVTGRGPDDGDYPPSFARRQRPHPIIAWAARDNRPPPRGSGGGVDGAAARGSSEGCQFWSASVHRQQPDLHHQ